MEHVKRDKCFKKYYIKSMWEDKLNWTQLVAFPLVTNNLCSTSVNSSVLLHLYYYNDGKNWLDSSRPCTSALKCSS